MAIEPLIDLTSIDLSQIAISAEDVGKLNPQAGDMRQLDYVAFLNEDNTIAVGVKEVKIDVNNNNDGKNMTYKFWFKVENLKLLSGTYDVGVSSKSISHFVNKNVDVQYWIALEPESKYDA